MKNRVYDIVILGASKDGIKTALKLKKKNQTLKVALVSTNFYNVTKNQDLSTIDCIANQCTLITYWYSSFKLSTIGKTEVINVLAKKLIIATGTTPAKLVINGSIPPDTYYNLHDLKEIDTKNSNVIVLGNNKLAGKFALAVRNKFRYIYLCSPTLELDMPISVKAALENSKNIAILGACKPVSYKTLLKIDNSSYSKTKKLQSVTLDTYDTIKCSAIIASIGRVPDITFFGARYNQFVEFTNGLIKVNDNCSSTRVPNLFIIGDGVYNYTRDNYLKLIQYLLQ